MELNTDRVKALMIEKRLTVASLARAAGIGGATINLWLNHGTRPRLDKLGALAGALGVPYTEIVKDKEC